MTEGESLLSGTLGLVLTDLFLAATATILMLLAVLRDTPDIPVPIQADLRMDCIGGTSLALSRWDQPGVVITLAEPEELGAAVMVLQAPPRLFQTVALVAAPKLSAGCLARAQRAVRDWNASLGSLIKNEDVMVLGLVAVAKPGEEVRR